MTKILIICGPTATGKTTLATMLAKKFNGELISADSRQVYRGMDIVTGKDKPKGVTIHGLSLVQPDEEFSVAHFVEYATTLINQISLTKKLPIIVGGTGLYLNSLLYPPATIKIKPDWQLRRQLELLSLLKLQKKLKKLDLARWQAMNRSDQNNPRRLIRAIEVGKFQPDPIFTAQRTDLKFDTLWVGLRADSVILDQRIAERVKARIKAGAIAEWQNLRQKYSCDLPSMSGIGYQQLPDVNAWTRAEQQYCRRQLTWFKINKLINWFDIAKKFEPEVVNLISTWYN